MPDHIGSFLKASKCFSTLGINITSVSYNKAVDSHTLFIDAEPTFFHNQKNTDIRNTGFHRMLSPVKPCIYLYFILNLKNLLKSNLLYEVLIEQYTFTNVLYANVFVFSMDCCKLSLVKINRSKTKNVVGNICKASCICSGCK